MFPPLLLVVLAAFVVITVTIVGSISTPEADSATPPPARTDPVTDSVSDGTQARPVTRPRGDESVRGPGTSALARRKRGEYWGPLVPIDQTAACPRVAAAFYRMREAAERSGVRLRVNSGFRTRKHQARLYRELGPQWAARPGTTLHHNATELDIRMRPGGGDRIHRWLQRHAGKFGFVQRYSWESWHWGFVQGCWPKRR